MSSCGPTLSNSFASSVPGHRTPHQRFPCLYLSPKGQSSFPLPLGGNCHFVVTRRKQPTVANGLKICLCFIRLSVEKLSVLESGCAQKGFHPARSLSLFK